MSVPSIWVNGVSYRYPGGARALKDITLTIEPGSRVAILGHNGAGKTTLVRHFNGLLTPTQGEVWVGDFNTRRSAVEELSGRVGYVFQNPDDQLFAKTIQEEVAFGPRNLGYDSSQVKVLVQSALELCGLGALADRHPYDIPWTKRRWAAIASVVAMDTPVLVLDEPTAGQDARGLERLRHLILQQSAQGKTIIAISHHLTFCAENFIRALVLRAGEVLFDGDFLTAFCQDNLFNEADLQLPQVTQVGLKLGFKQPVLTIPEFLAAYRQYLSDRTVISEE
ncbi:MAG: ABC transporter ATP-binding protein [Anaerolineaceae bacterium]|nr:ABC transporter ATP-binding protein [Anaerolineaceae bacterium]